MGPVPKTLKIEPSTKAPKKRTRSRSAQRITSTPTNSSTEEKLKAKLFDLETENVQLKKKLEQATKAFVIQKDKHEREASLLQAKLNLADKNIETLMQEKLKRL